MQEPLQASCGICKKTFWTKICLKGFLHCAWALSAWALSTLALSTLAPRACWGYVWEVLWDMQVASANTAVSDQSQVYVLCRRLSQFFPLHREVAKTKAVSHREVHIMTWDIGVSHLKAQRCPDALQSSSRMVFVTARCPQFNDDVCFKLKEGEGPFHF